MPPAGQLPDYLPLPPSPKRAPDPPPRHHPKAQRGPAAPRPLPRRLELWQGTTPWGPEGRSGGFPAPAARALPGTRSAGPAA